MQIVSPFLYKQRDIVRAVLVTGDGITANQCSVQIGEGVDGVTGCYVEYGSFGVQEPVRGEDERYHSEETAAQCQNGPNKSPVFDESFVFLGKQYICHTAGNTPAPRMFQVDIAVRETILRTFGLGFVIVYVQTRLDLFMNGIRAQMS